MGDVGRWGACSSCAHWIEASKWDRLVTRVMGEVQKRKGFTVEDFNFLRADLRLMYKALSENLVQGDGQALTVLQPHYSRIPA
jgi:hypothetical protein